MGFSQSKAAKIQFSLNLKHHSNPVYHVMHAFRCRKEFATLSNDQPGKATFFPNCSLPPPLQRPFGRHIGVWSSIHSFENWLWLYFEALECRSQPADFERAERLAFYLSLIAFKWQTSGSTDIDLLLQVLLSEHPIPSSVQERIKRSVSHHLQELNRSIERVKKEKRTTNHKKWKIQTLH